MWLARAVVCLSHYFINITQRKRDMNGLIYPKYNRDPLFLLQYCLLHLYLSFCIYGQKEQLSPFIYIIHIHTFHRNLWTHNWSALNVSGSNLVEVLKFFQASLHNCINYIHYNLLWGSFFSWFYFPQFIWFISYTCTSFRHISLFMLHWALHKFLVFSGALITIALVIDICLSSSKYKRSS